MGNSTEDYKGNGPMAFLELGMGDDIAVPIIKRVLSTKFARYSPPFLRAFALFLRDCAQRQDQGLMWRMSVFRC